MAVKYGQPGRALGLSTMGSMFGGIFSAVCLIVFSPQLAKVALQFSKPEYFALAIFGISIITSVSAGSMIKGIMGGIIGLLIATIGIDAMSGKLRFTFGSTYLLGGLSFVPVLIGLFAFSQVLLNVEECYGKELVKQAKAIAETSKVAIRNIRRDGNDELKKMQKDGSLTEDGLKTAEEALQKSTDKFIADINKILEDKEKEIMEG